MLGASHERGIIGGESDASIFLEVTGWRSIMTEA